MRPVATGWIGLTDQYIVLSVTWPYFPNYRTVAQEAIFSLPLCHTPHSLQGFSCFFLSLWCALSHSRTQPPLVCKQSVCPQAVCLQASAPAYTSVCNPSNATCSSGPNDLHLSSFHFYLCHFIFTLQANEGWDLTDRKHHSAQPS